jgi:hypothetical protein
VCSLPPVFVYIFHDAHSEWGTCESCKDPCHDNHGILSVLSGLNSRSETRSIFRINPLSNPFLFYSMVAAFLAQIAVILYTGTPMDFQDKCSTLGVVKIGLGFIGFVAL